MRRLALVLCGLTLGLVAAGCGGGASPTGRSDDVTAVLRDLRSLQPGEILIVGRRPRKLAGPYTFSSGRYLLRFRQAGRARLRIALHSHRDSTAKPYQLVVDTRRPRGAAQVTITGKLYVRVVADRPPYTLRFTPKR